MRICGSPLPALQERFCSCIGHAGFRDGLASGWCCGHRDGSGIGKLVVDSIYARDYPMLQGALLLIAGDLCGVVNCPAKTILEQAAPEGTLPSPSFRLL